MKKIIVNIINVLVSMAAFCYLVMIDHAIADNFGVYGYILALTIAFVILIESGINIINALPFED